MLFSNTIVVFLGPPAAGKGSQARLLSRIASLPLLVIGDILRDISQQDTPQGLHIRAALAYGALMDNQVIAEVIRTRTQHQDFANSYIIDGYPRSLDQAQWLDRWATLEKKNIVAIYLTIPRELVLIRATQRRNCRVCGEVFNAYTRLPKRRWICDFCGSDLDKRADDIPGILEQRYETFQSETLPVVEYYQRGGILRSVDGCQEIDSVFDDLCRIICPVRDI